MLIANLLKCVDCGQIMVEENTCYKCLACGRQYFRDDKVFLAVPEKVDELSESEAHYHDEFDEDAQSIHQLNAFRNIFYHRLIWNKINSLSDGSLVLEVGAGSGFDAANLKEGLNLVLSDISLKTIKRVSNKFADKKSEYFVADGLKLPFSDGVFDALYIVATFHHFASPSKALDEFRRVLKPEGFLLIGVEPNWFYFSMIKKFRTYLCKIAHMENDEVSQADAEMEGFKYSDWKSFFEKKDWKDLEIKPMWFFSGYIHYLSEFAYRSFGFKKRLIMSDRLEKIIIFVDELLSKIPIINRFSWHWIISVTKK